MGAIMYRIEFEGRYGESYGYRIEDDISGIAKYLNKRVKETPEDRIVAVYVADDYSAGGVYVSFLPQEYNNQRFIESYEERLIAYNEYMKNIGLIF